VNHLGIANTNVNSALYPFGVGQSNTDLSGYMVKARHVHLSRVPGNTVRSHVVDDAV